LHGKAEFEGTGIGLAIALKIIQKHQGHISAGVGESGGAVFDILLPESIETRHVNHTFATN
jgi:signal transduction histidine kinase